MNQEIEITIGTYENLILGYRIQENVSGGYTLESSFTNDSHRGALRCMAVSPRGVLASSSTDDSIRLHSLKKRKEVGSLFQHDGSVNCINFIRGGYMFSASEDGTICLWRCKNWELLRVFKGHRSHVMALAVHPSAKLGLSVGSDRSFFTWDLTTGKLAFKRKTEEVVQNILFTQSGDNYVLVYQNNIEICSLEDTLVKEDVKLNSRINSVCFVEENILAVGCDDGKLYVLDVLSNKIIFQETFKGRLKSLCPLVTKTDILLFVASSNGSIRVCNLDFTEGCEKLSVLMCYESGVRITCLAVFAPPGILKEDSNTDEKQNIKRNSENFENAEFLEDEEEEDIEYEEVKKELDLDPSDEDSDEAISTPDTQISKKKKKIKTVDSISDEIISTPDSKNRTKKKNRKKRVKSSNTESDEETLTSETNISKKKNLKMQSPSFKENGSSKKRKLANKQKKQTAEVMHQKKKKIS